jgi:hypothetical protein
VKIFVLGGTAFFSIWSRHIGNLPICLKWSTPSALI